MVFVVLSCNPFVLTESDDPITKLTIIDMLCYSLEHAEKNLPQKQLHINKVCCFCKIYLHLYVLVFCPISFCA